MLFDAVKSGSVYFVWRPMTGPTAASTAIGSSIPLVSMGRPNVIIRTMTLHRILISLHYQRIVDVRPVYFLLSLGRPTTARLTILQHTKPHVFARRTTDAQNVRSSRAASLSWTPPPILSPPRPHLRRRRRHARRRAWATSGRSCEADKATTRCNTHLPAEPSLPYTRCCSTSTSPTPPAPSSTRYYTSMTPTTTTHLW